jgi:hypothetical protein
MDGARTSGSNRATSASVVMEEALIDRSEPQASAATD